MKGDFGMWKEFKEFISRGNVIDLAVGVVIGGAFGKIVNSFVTDIISPFIALITGASDLSSLVITLKPEQVVNGETIEATVVNYGLFIESIIDFLIIGFAIFILIKIINKFRRKEQEKEEVEVPQVEVLLAEIRDELKKRG